ncbi:MAG: NHLP bacteriocin export ABC transporter permease/ATPase subunit [Proteobacteria bacterium]|nr:NHLP bacteriocin export ABC transporter permease/ATPase subunit [Pseudomonadota bacterium]
MSTAAFSRFIASLPGAVLEQTGGNHPITADDETMLYLVDTGTIDLFTVQVIEGKRAGARLPLVQIAENQIFIGVRPQQNRTLTAVGTADTKIYRVALDTLLKSLEDDKTIDRSEELADALDSWIRCLQAGIQAPYPPTKCRRLLKPETVTLGPYHSLCAARGVLWARVNGEVTWLDDAARLASPLIALSTYSWIQATEKGATVTLLPTAALVGQAEMWQALLQCQNQMLAAVVALEARQRAQDHERVVRRAASEGASLDEAIHDVAAVFSTRETNFFSHARFADALLDACEMVGEYQGLKIERPAGSTEGLATDALWRICRASHCQTRQVVLRDSWWKRDSGPILAYIDETRRPVALLPDGPHRYRMYDPVERTSVAVDAAVAKTLDPNAQMLYRNLPERPLVPLDLLKFGLRTTWRDLVTLLVMGLLTGLLSLATPVGLGMLTSTIIPSGQSTELAALAGALLAASLGSACYSLVRQFSMQRMETRMEYDVQAGLLTRLIALPASFFRTYTSGDLSNRLLGIIQVRSALSSAVTQAVLNGLFSVFSFFLLFYYDTYMAVVAAVLVLFYTLVSASVAYAQVRQQRTILDLTGSIQGLVLQLITGVSKIRVAGAESRAFREWADRFSHQRTLQFDNRMVSVRYGGFTSAYPVLCSLIFIAWVSGHDYKGITTGDFLAFNAAFGQFMSALTSLTGTWIQMQMIGPLVDRARPILEATMEADSSKPDAGRLEGALELRSVSFRYGSDGPLILENVNFKADPGEMIAIVGPSGSGKSTLMRMLLGFDNPLNGDVLYDNQSLTQIDVQSVRRQIGVVLQDGKLQPGNIFNNIVGSTLMTEDDAWEAARIAGIEQEIRQLPMGMHTVLSEGATTFSGGQRQRLMIARAVVGRPRYIFLDEATSALDAEIQEQVTRSLDALETTRIVIAHRLSTIRRADRIYVLHKGRIEQEGTFTDLLNQPGLFQDLARRQLA